MALGSNLAGVARVAFEAQTATFYTELKAVEARYEATLARMSAASARFSSTPLTMPQAGAAVMGRPGAAVPAPSAPAGVPVSTRPPLSDSPEAVRQRARRRAAGIGPAAVAGAGGTVPTPALTGAAKGMDTYTASTGKATAATKGFAASTGAAQKSTMGMTSGILRSSLAFAGIIGVTAVVRGLTANLAESQRVTAQTASVIESTGGIAGVTAKQIDEMAQAYQRTTLFTDEQVQSGLNMLLTFKNIRNSAGENNDIFNQTSDVLVDMGAAFNRMSGGSDGLQRSSILLGKAMNDPIRGITALTRVGVTFTEQEREQIKTMVENGNVMGAQQKILAELNSEFGGSAEGGAKTFTGQMIVLRHSLEESAETFLNDLAPALEIVVKLVGGLVRVLSPLKPAIVVLAGAWALWKIQILLTNAALVKSIVNMVRMTAVSIAQVGVMNTLRASWIVLNAVMAANPIGAVIVAIALLAAGFALAWKHSETFRKIVETVFHAVGLAVSKYVGIIVRYIQLWIGAMAKMAEAASHIPFIGDHFKGVADKLWYVNDQLGKMSGKLEDLTQKPWNVEVNVNTKQTGDAVPPGGPRPTGPADPRSVAGSSMFDLPAKFTEREAIAKRRGDDDALMRVYEEEVAWLKRKLRRTDLNYQERASLNDALAQANANIQGLNDDAAQEQQDAIDAQKQHDEDMADARAEARAKGFETPGKIEAGKSRASLTEIWLADDLKWYRRELAFLRKKRAMTDLTYAEMKDLDDRIKATEDKIDELHAEQRRRRQERDQLLIENAMARAELTPKISDDIAVLNREELAIRKRLAILKRRERLSNEELAEQTRLFQRLKAIRDQKKALREENDAEETKLTKEAFEKMSFQFLTGLHGIGNQFGSNLQANAGSFGQLETHANAQTALLRQQNELLKGLSGQAKHPNTKYTRNALTAATTGVGF